jgi:hypothetical protein
MALALKSLIKQIMLCCLNYFSLTSVYLEQRLEAISRVSMHFGDVKIVKPQIVASSWTRGSSGQIWLQSLGFWCHHLNDQFFMLHELLFDQS